MTKNKQLKLIEERQNEYVDLLIKLINDRKNNPNKELNFQSQTGTGKSIMIAKLINKLPNLFFIITTLSRGNLKSQLQDSFEAFLHKDNYVLFASQDLTKNTILQANDFIKEIKETNINHNPIIWIRDEGHIATNNFSALFKDMVELQINVSATNKHINDIDCNFLDTCMLRTPILNTGTYIDAIKKLIEIKELHKNIKNYNPCMVARVLDEKLNKEIREYAKLCNLNVIDLNDDTFNMKAICSDDSIYDIIINKMKIVEGVDIRRCHVMYISNKIGTDTTNVQLIGRSRRNALLWRNDIDLFKDISKDLFRETQKSYIYYNYNENVLETDEFGNLQRVCCDLISVEKLKPNINIEVENGRLPNGFRVMELEGKTGTFHINVDTKTGFNIVDNEDFYNVKDISIEEEAKYLGELFYNSYISSDFGSDIKLKSKKTIIDVVGKNQFIGRLECYYIYIQSKDLYAVCRANEHRTLLEVFKKIGNKFVKYSYSCDKLMKILLAAPFKDFHLHYTLVKNDNNLELDKAKNKVETLIDKGYLIKNYILQNNIFNDFVVYQKNENLYCVHFRDNTYRECKIINNMCNYLNKLIINDDNRLINYLNYKYQAKISNVSCIDYYQHKVLIKFLVEYVYEDCERSLIQKQYKEWFIKYNFLTYDYIKKHNLSVNSMRTMSNFQELNDYIKKYDQNFIPYKDDKYFNFIQDLKNSYTYPNSINDFNSLRFIDRRILKNVYNTQTLILDLDEFEKITGINNIEIDNEIEITISEISNKDYIWAMFSEEEISDHCSKKLINYRNRTCAKLNNLFDYSEIVKIKEDKELKIIGNDLTQYSKQLNSFINDVHISTNIAQYTKLSRFISKKYNSILQEFKGYSKHVNNNFPKRCNLLLEICVIYYAKYLIYGKKILSYYLKGDSKEDIINACVEKYKELQRETYGNTLIKNIRIDELKKDEYQPFCDKVVELASATVSFLKSDLVSFDSNNILHPALVCDEIIGICDFIDNNTIIDIKCSATINETMIKQILAYYYLSTKRNDLNIKKIIVYDVITNNYVLITTNNMKLYKNY